MNDPYSLPGSATTEHTEHNVMQSQFLEHTLSRTNGKTQNAMTSSTEQVHIIISQWQFSLSRNSQKESCLATWKTTDKVSTDSLTEVILRYEL